MDGVTGKISAGFFNDNSSEGVSQTEQAVEETLIDWMAEWLQDVLSTPILSHFKWGSLNHMSIWLSFHFIWPFQIEFCKTYTSIV
jgi:hypothetical protein